MWWTRRRTDEDFSREIDAHLALETDRLVDDGLSPDAARDAARRAFGNTAAAQERFHEANHWMWLEQLVQDLRYAVRGLWHAACSPRPPCSRLPSGSGWSRWCLPIFNAYVLRPFAVRDPYSLHRIVWTAPDAFGGSFRWQDYEELRGRHDLFRDVIAEATRYRLVGQRAGLGGVCLGQLLRVARRARPAGAPAGQLRRRRSGQQPGRGPERRRLGPLLRSRPGRRSASPSISTASGSSSSA